MTRDLCVIISDISKCATTPDIKTILPGVGPGIKSVGLGFRVAARGACAQSRQECWKPLKRRQLEAHNCPNSTQTLTLPSLNSNHLTLALNPEPLNPKCMGATTHPFYGKSFRGCRYLFARPEEKCPNPDTLWQ